LEAPCRFPVSLIFGIGGGAFRGERVEIYAVRRAGGGRKPGAGELLDEGGDPLIAGAAMGETGIAEPARDPPVEPEAVPGPRPVGGDRALGALRRDRAGAVRQQETDQRLEDKEIGGLALACEQGEARRLGEAAPAEKLVVGNAAEGARLMPGRRRRGTDQRAE